MAAIKKNMIVLHLSEEMPLNKVEWKKMIHVAGSKNSGKRLLVVLFTLAFLKFYMCIPSII